MLRWQKLNAWKFLTRVFNFRHLTTRRKLNVNISYAKKKAMRKFPDLRYLAWFWVAYVKYSVFFCAINFTATITNNLPDTTRLPLHPFTGPSAPRGVTVRLITPRLVEVRWRAPAVSNGQIIRYTVYAIPIAVSGRAISKRQAASNLPSGTIKHVCLHMWLSTYCISSSRRRGYYLFVLVATFQGWRLICWEAGR